MKAFVPLVLKPVDLLIRLLLSCYKVYHQNVQHQITTY